LFGCLCLNPNVDEPVAPFKFGALHYKRYAKEQALDDRERYAAADDEARANHAGLWQNRNPVLAREWRPSRRRRQAN
jgi:endonuclease YncB( thermonuclease family)